MKAHALAPADITAAQTGWVLTQDIRDSSGTLRLPKGTALAAADLDTLREHATHDLHLVEREPGDLHENDAASQVATAICGEHLTIREPNQSRVDLVARRRGLVRIDADLLRAINSVGEITVYTTIDLQPVDADTPVASVKVSPIVTTTAKVAAIEQLCRAAAGPLVALEPFVPRPVAVILVGETSAEQRDRVRAALSRKVAWFGAELRDCRCVPHERTAVAAAFRAALSDGAGVVLVAGGNPIDPLDPVLAALADIGATLVHSGAPTRGSMSWLARAGSVQILNLASARMYLGHTVGDLYLPPLMRAEPVAPEDVIALGYGGMPGSAVSLRVAPYEGDGGR
ncbi:MAG: hypothetical protein M9890_04725 [Thermomicrobiales bacterium]|nr:hypothetical protein [Thermomicrobiales bacterium]